MSSGKVALVIAGIVIALVGFGAAVAGGGMLWAHSQRASDGYLASPTWTFETDGAAVTAEEIDLGAPTRDDWLWFRRFEVRIDVESTTADPVFVGIAPRADVDAYLDGVPHSEIARLGGFRDTATYRTSPGTTMPEPPGDQTFWAARAQGPGVQQMTWQAEPGTWALVVMNADGEPGVAVQASAAAQAGFLLPLGVALLASGILLLLGAVAMITIAAAGGRNEAPDHPAPVGSAGAPGAPGAPVGRIYPVTVEGRLDAPLSRWLWLVKWVLLIPHLVVLVFLWAAFVMLTVVAGVAILFTGRYPRAIFDFNVGVIRWTWRVTYYSYSALGTDRYPPFTLAAVDYPATLDVSYPQRLSRGLVLVKWWLLAIPHYLIVGLLVGGGITWTTTDQPWGAWTLAAGGGIIGVLVLVVGLLLLFANQYPRGLYDIIIGLNRWVYRVLAYAALMTDEYPPFRLDLGGSEPQPASEPPPGPAAGGQAELVHH